MQFDPLLIRLIGPFILGLILGFIVVFIALYFATRIVTNQVVTPRAAVIGAVITVLVFEVSRFVTQLVVPTLSDWVALVCAAIVLLILLWKYYDIGLFSTLALVMLTLAIIFAISAIRTALFIIFIFPA